MIAGIDHLYHARRARAEAIRAIEAGPGVVSAIHRELCVLHCGRVVEALSQGSRE